MKLVIGLGNVGSKYSNTRHNIGFLCIDHYAELKGYRFSKDRLYEYFVHSNTVFIKPTTFMNNSGLALDAAQRKWKIEEVLIIYDDLELSPACMRIRAGGGDGGHNGLKSLFIYQDPSDIKRIRIGIGKNLNEKAEKYVLDNIDDKYRPAYNEVFSLVAKFLDTYIHSGFKQLLDEFSKWKRAYSSKTDAGIISPKEETDD